MKLIENEEIESLNISPATCVKWAEEALKLKYKSLMPPKSAIHLHDSLNFFMTMPCLLPDEYGYFGCKNASRFDCSHPSVKSYMMLCNSHNGNFEALVNCDWITSHRTGATAALAIKTYRSTNAKIYSFMGMGLAGCSALECFLDASSNEQYTVRILQYKDHAEKTIEKFKHYKNVNFEIAETPELLIDGADVIVSAITQAPDLIVNDTSLFKPGVLLVPVHTRGFQNCDKIFDKIFGDDTKQISCFQYFNEFKSFNEFSEVLLGLAPGRENDQQRIIAYNIGLGLHDVYFGYKILQLLKNRENHN